MGLIIALIVALLVVVLLTTTAPRRRRPLTMSEVVNIDFNYDILGVMGYVMKHTDYTYPALRDRALERLQAVIRDQDEAIAAMTAAQPAVAVMPDEVEESPELVFEEIPFKPDEPQTFNEFSGQPQVIRPLRTSVRALGPEERVPDHVLLTGPPGLGKTLVAKVFANEVDLHAYARELPSVPFFWTFAANLESTDDFDKVVRDIQAAGGGVWFIDEIHVLDKEMATKLYSLMEDGLYPFHGDVQPTKVPDVCIVGATTDYGGMHGALKRRFGESLMMRPMSWQELFEIITNREFPIDPEAATLLINRTHFSGAPWESLVLLREAEKVARADGRTTITPKDVQEVFETYDIDDLGLRWIDRAVIRALFGNPRFKGAKQEFVCYGASEKDTCSLSGLDPEEYRETVKPRLMARGLIGVRAGYGQVLTPKCIEQYSHLKPE